MRERGNFFVLYTVSIAVYETGRTKHVVSGTTGTNIIAVHERATRRVARMKILRTFVIITRLAATGCGAIYFSTGIRTKRET